MTIVFMDIHGVYKPTNIPGMHPQKAAQRPAKGCPVRLSISGVSPCQPRHAPFLVPFADVCQFLQWTRRKLLGCYEMHGNGLPNGLPNANDMLIYWRLRPVWDFSWENQLRMLFQESGEKTQVAWHKRKNINGSGHPAKPLFSWMSVHQVSLIFVGQKFPLIVAVVFNFLVESSNPPKHSGNWVCDYSPSRIPPRPFCFIWQGCWPVCPCVFDEFDITLW